MNEIRYNIFSNMFFEFKDMKINSRFVASITLEDKEVRCNIIYPNGKDFIIKEVFNTTEEAHLFDKYITNSIIEGHPLVSRKIFKKAMEREEMLAEHTNDDDQLIINNLLPETE